MPVISKGLAAELTQSPEGECLCPGNYQDRTCREKHCVTVERWAAACRKAHWNEDDDLLPWGTFVDINRPPLRDTSEPDLWRSVARMAIEALGKA